MNIVGRYQIKSELGRGGMATVYLAYDPRFKREVAVKLLPREFLHDTGFRSRFEREAQTIAALEHPAIVPVYDYGEADGILYLVMRYLPGGSLTRRIAQGPLSLPDAVRILRRLAPGLDYAHAQGMVHRDLKPGNILFDAWENPYLSDFGIVKLALGSETALTKTGGLVGTPAYMSPEQVRGLEELDGRSDVYALGVLLYHMLSGKLPYEADTPIGQAFMHVNAPVPAIGEVREDLPPAASQVISRALAKERDDRHDSAGALAEALAQAAPSAPTPPPRPAEPQKQSAVSVAAQPEVRPDPPAAKTQTPHPQDAPQSRGRRRVPLWGWVLLLVVPLLLGIGAILIAPQLLPGTGSATAATSPGVVAGAGDTTTPTSDSAEAPAPAETAAPQETTVAASGETTPVREPTPSVAPVDDAAFSCDDPLGCVNLAPGEPIRIASALDLSGPAAPLGLDSQRGVEIALQLRQEIAGHPLQLRAEDTACSGEGGEAVVQYVVSDPTIVGLIGTSCSVAALPAAEIIAQNGYLMISPSNTTPSLTDRGARQDGYFRTAHNDRVQGLAMAQFAYNELGARTAAAIHEGEPYTEGLTSTFADAFSALGGEIIAIEPTEPSGADVTLVLEAIAAAGPPDFLYYPVFFALGADLTRQARQFAELQGTFLAGADGMLTPAFLEDAGESALGMFISGPDLAFENPLYDDFLATYEQSYGEAPLAPFHAHAYDATNILLDAIEQVAQAGGDGALLIGRQSLRDAVGATTDFGGITGTLTCDANGDCADPRIAVHEVQQIDGALDFIPMWTYAP